MNKLYHIIVIAIPAIIPYTHVIGEQQVGKLADRDGNTYTTRSFPDNKIWMTQNLKINIPGSFCYGNDTGNCNQYGRLYTWSSAVAGCKELGESWRLPTSEEWQQMARSFGGVVDDSKDSGRAAYQALIFDGDASFNAVFGGSRDPDGVYRRLEAHGFYWTATEIDSSTAWFYNFGKNGKMLNRHDGEKERAASVRCIMMRGNE